MQHESGEVGCNEEQHSFYFYVVQRLVVPGSTQIQHIVEF